MRLVFGQEVNLKMRGKPEKAYVADKDPESEYIIKLAYRWPFSAGDEVFFIHREKLIQNIRKQHFGKQLKLKE